MRVTIDPSWTFFQALDAAWEAYRGGRQFGVPYRLAVLEQWANVVGRERATTEIETTLAGFSDLDAAADDLGLSKYAIGKLRRRFREMPSATAHTSARQNSGVFDVLKMLQGMSAEHEVPIIATVVAQLANAFGYTNSEVQFEVSVGRGLRADALLSHGSPLRPRVVVEVKRETNGGDRLRNAIAQLRTFMAAANSPHGIILSPQHAVVVTGPQELTFPLAHLSKSDADRIAEILRPSATAPAEPPSPQPPAHAELTALLNRVSAASTNDEKKKSLEDLAAAVFETHSFLRCKYRNLRTRSSEIDLVCEVSAVGGEFLREFGRYFLVECKNWSSPAGAKEVRDFIGKIRKARLRLGILFSRNGITGEQHGTDALREIHSAFDYDGTCLVVVSEADLSNLANLSDVLRLVDEKLDSLRFDL